MGRHRFFSLRVSLLLLLLMPRGLLCVSVHIQNEQPIYQIPSSSLLLRARIEQGPLEDIATVTWEREVEAGLVSKKETLATCPSKGPDCSHTRSNVHADVNQQGTTLRIDGYSAGDSGLYAVTVTSQMGAKAAAHCIVREYEAVHHVTVSINVSHSILVCGEAWGTEPRFGWLHERASITDAVGRVSNDGKELFVSLLPICGDFTCMVSNKLSHSSATYTAAPCKVHDRGTTAAYVSMVILMLFGGVVVSLLLWRRHRHNARGQRLDECLDDNI